MKLMLCGDCGDVVSPGMRDMTPRWCHCQRHAVWWRDGAKGLLSVHDKLFPERNGSPGGKAWVIGLHNGLLTGVEMVHDPNVLVARAGDEPEFQHELRGNSCTHKEVVQFLLRICPDSYLFKRVGSLAIRFTPGYSNDTRWDATVPGAGA